MASANKVVTQGDVQEQIDLLRYSNVQDFKIGTVLASTREQTLYR